LKGLRFAAAVTTSLTIAAGAWAQETPPAPAPEKAVDPDRARIEATLAAQEAAIAELRANALADKQAREDDARAREATAVKVGGYVQSDWVIHRQSSEDEVNGATGAPLNENRFVLRRARIRAEADRGIVGAALEIDANTVNGPLVRPIDAEAWIQWPAKRTDGGPYIAASIGLLRTPFGFEVQEKDSVRPFLERATVLRAMFPGEFDLGLRLKGGYRAFEYAFGVLNGDPIGERQFPGRDPNESKDLLGRIGVDTAIVPGIRVQAGISALTGRGFHKGTASTKDVLVWRDVNEDGVVQSTEVQVIGGSAATPSQTFHRFALGADLRLIAAIPVIGELTVRGEIVRGANLDRSIQVADPVSTGRDLREVGWYVGFTQEITRWAIVGLRYDRYDPDADASEQRAIQLVPKDATFSTWAFTGALRYGPARLVLEYDKNGNALGRGVNGAPTTLKDDALTLRAQVTF
jgi:hypothetical protein